MRRSPVGDLKRTLLQSLALTPRPLTEMLALAGEERVAFFAMIESAYLEIEDGFVVVNRRGRLALRGIVPL